MEPERSMHQEKAQLPISIEMITTKEWKWWFVKGYLSSTAVNCALCGCMTLKYVSSTYAIAKHSPRFCSLLLVTLPADYHHCGCTPRHSPRRLFCPPHSYSAHRSVRSVIPLCQQQPNEKGNHDDRCILTNYYSQTNDGRRPSHNSY